jgi:hypothetical protein
LAYNTKEVIMNLTSVTMAVIALSLGVTILFAGFVGLTAFLFSHACGASASSSLRAGATAFTATFTLSLGVLALLAETLH